MPETLKSSLRDVEPKSSPGLGEGELAPPQILFLLHLILIYQAAAAGGKPERSEGLPKAAAA
jgi:hypothetical protein